MVNERGYPVENRIKILRKERNLTQDELAKIIGVVLTTIAGYERGVICPSQDKLILLAQYFGVSADYIIGKTDIRNEPSTTSKDIYTNLQVIIDVLRSNDEIYYAGNRLTDPQKQNLHDIIYQNSKILLKSFNIYSR